MVVLGVGGDFGWHEGQDFFVDGQSRRKTSKHKSLIRMYRNQIERLPIAHESNIDDIIFELDYILRSRNILRQLFRMEQ